MKFSKQSQVLALTLAALAGGSAQAALSVGNSAYTYGQTFDSLASTGTANAWANDSTLQGWSLFNGAAPVTTYRAGTGSTTNGAYYSFGTDAADRALGGVGSGSFFGHIVVSFTNDTGSALAGFNLSFDGEQWRNGGNANQAAQTMTMEYGFGASLATVGTWNAPGGNFDWASPVTTATAAAVDGNVAGLVAGRGGNVTAAWNAGETLWVRWIENNDGGNDHGLAIDNLSFSVVASAVPEPETYAMLLAGLACVGFVARRRKI